MKNNLFAFLLLIYNVAFVFSQQAAIDDNKENVIKSLEKRIEQLESTILKITKNIEYSSDDKISGFQIKNTDGLMRFEVGENGPMIRLFKKNGEQVIFTGIVADTKGNNIIMQNGVNKIVISANENESEIWMSNDNNQVSLLNEKDRSGFYFSIDNGNGIRDVLSLISENGFGKLQLESIDNPWFVANSIYPGSKIMSKDEWFEIKFSISHDSSAFVSDKLFTNDIQMRVLQRNSIESRKALNLPQSESPALYISVDLGTQPIWSSKFRSGRFDVIDSVVISELEIITEKLMNTAKFEFLINFNNTQTKYEDHEIYIDYSMNNYDVCRYLNGKYEMK